MRWPQRRSIVSSSPITTGPSGTNLSTMMDSRRAASRRGFPAAAVEELMIGGKIGHLCSTSDPQACRHSSLARRKDRTHHKDQKVLSTGRGKPETKWRQPLAKDVGDRVSPLTATIMLFAHPSVRIRSSERRKGPNCDELIHPRPISRTEKGHRVELRDGAASAEMLFWGSARCY
jgi:hypothetical protein